MKKIFVTWHDVQRQTQEILRQMQKESWKPDYIVGITRGGLTLSNLLSQYLDVTMYTLDVRLRDGKHVPCESNHKLAELAFGINNDMSNGARWDTGRRKKILIVDDINDSGASINWIKQDWMNACMPNETDAWNSVWSGNVRFATLTDNLASNFDQCVNYCCDTINKDKDDVWLVYPWENVGEY